MDKKNIQGEEMKAKGRRWAELSNGHICLIDTSNGQILARALKGLDGTFKYKDTEFIDSHSVMTYIENEKGEIGVKQ
jgi:hypothetical protein